MTVAALQALALRRHLDRHGSPRYPALQRALVRVTAVPWDMARGADLAFPDVAGPRSRASAALGSYIARVHAAAAHDALVGRAFMRVSGLVAPPPALLHPAVVGRALWHGRRRRVC
jgi:hypothetical protein